MLPFSYLARCNEKNKKLHAFILTEMEKWLQLTECHRKLGSDEH